VQSVIKQQSAKVGLPPGTPVHVGEERVDKARIRLVLYDGAHIEERDARDAENAHAAVGERAVTWIDVDGVHDVDLIARLGRQFNLHPLAIEDIVNTAQRPKAQDYGNFYFIVLKLLFWDPREDEIASDQISIVLGETYVMSFSEQLGDEFQAVRAQLVEGLGRIRALGADYLAYRLVDTVIDGYFGILEDVGVRLEALEDRVLSSVRGEFLNDLHEIKRELLFARAAIGPVDALTSEVLQSASPLLAPQMRVYWADVRDHTLNAIETINTLRDMGAGNLDVYLSGVTYRQNDISRLLTIIATIFLPLTFLVGVWGMNFKFMPELDKPWGYWSSLAFMFLVAVSMIAWFKKKNWL
jgi:magnesium transporter